MEQTECEKKYFPSRSQAGDLLFTGLSWGTLVHVSPEQDQLGPFLLSEEMLVFGGLPVASSRSGGFLQVISGSLLSSFTGDRKSVLVSCPRCHLFLWNQIGRAHV